MMIPLPLFSNVAALSGTGYDAATTAWVNAVVAASGTVSATQKGYVDTLIKSLKSGGVWTLLDRCFIFASENSQQATIDLVNLATATNNGATFTANQGWAGNGSTTYLDSGFNLSTGTNFTQNNSHFSEWRRTTSAVATTRCSGALDGGATNGTYISTQAALGQINGGTGTQIAISGGAESGHFLIVRTSSSAVASYLSGTSQATGSSDTSFAGLNQTYWIGGRNFGGSINQAHDAQSLALTFGASLTSGQVTTLYNALNAYKTSVGA